MNTYRVTFIVNDTAARRYDVDATHAAIAIRRALDGFSHPNTDYVRTTCILRVRNIKRHYSDPKVRAVS